MSRRTSESNKAIRLAWEREQKLIQEGKGTRDWTPEQQKTILDPNIGKAYDDNGYAFEGQHMKSVKTYPEYQGDPNNIQFLTRQEHFEAHDCDWNDPTNWYFDPVTKEKTDFGDKPPMPCKVQVLSNPVIIIKNEPKVYENKQVQEDSNHKCCVETLNSDRDVVKNENTEQPFGETRLKHEASIAPQKTEQRIFRRTWRKVKSVAKIGWEIVKEHPAEAMGVVLKLIEFAAKISGGDSSGNNSSNTNGEYPYVGGSSISNSDYYDNEEINDENMDYDGSEIELANKILADENTFEGSHSSKRPHDRRGYRGHRWKGKRGNQTLEEVDIRATKIHGDSTADDA